MVFRKRVQGGNLKSSVVARKKVLKNNEESEEEENSNAEVANSNDSNSSSTSSSSAESVACLDGVLPSAAGQLAIAYIFVKVFRAKEDEIKQGGEDGIATKIKHSLGLDKNA
jgi:hypothetical protein